MMTRTLTEEFLLLALDDSSGKPLLDRQKLHAAIAGAAITQLVLDGTLEVATTDGEVKAGRLRRTGANPPTDALLTAVVEVAHGRKPKDAVSRIGGASDWRGRAGSLKDQLLEGLAREGVLAPERAKVLGLFPTTAWKPVDGRPEQEVRDRVLAALHGTAEPDPRTAGLVALLSATGIVAKVFPAEDKRFVKDRAKQIAEGSWAGEAVKKALEEIQAVMTAVVVSTVVASSSST